MNINKTIKNDKAIIIIASIIIFYFLFMLIVINIVINKTVYASSKLENVELKEYEDNINIEKIDLNEIINENLKNVYKEEIITENVEIEYITKYKNNADLAKGDIAIIQEGRDGTKQIIIKNTYKENELIKTEEVGSTITKASINKIVEVGTGEYKTKYKIKKGDTVYVKSDTLAIRISPDETSKKIITINKNDVLKVLEIQGQWYNVSYNSYVGWVLGGCVTHNQPYVKENVTNHEGEVLALDKNMKLNTPSGFTLEQFKVMLGNDSKDKNNLFKNNYQYFYYIESQYNINGIFVAAVGIHESNWGQSKISIDKKNLFGYGANDSNPYNNSYSFNSYSEGIDLIARVLVKYYLNPNGTKIYDSQIATGAHYNGNSISGVGKKYASDKNWANAVYKWMSYLYEKL